MLVEQFKKIFISWEQIHKGYLFARPELMLLRRVVRDCVRLAHARLRVRAKFLHGCGREIFALFPVVPVNSFTLEVTLQELTPHRGRVDTGLHELQVLPPVPLLCFSWRRQGRGHWRRG